MDAVLSLCPGISCTFMSIPTQNFLPLHSTFVPNQKAHVHIGSASVSLPSHARNQSENDLRLPCAIGRAKEGVWSSARIELPECSLRYSVQSIMHQMLTLRSQKELKDSHVGGMQR